MVPDAVGEPEPAGAAGGHRWLHPDPEEAAERGAGVARFLLPGGTHEGVQRVPAAVAGPEERGAQRKVQELQMLLDHFACVSYKYII